MGVVVEECNVMVYTDEIILTTEELTLQTGCHINRCRYNRVRLQFKKQVIKLRVLLLWCCEQANKTWGTVRSVIFL